jgi:nucleotide-binding universal stress UspA family protein
MRKMLLTTDGSDFSSKSAAYLAQLYRGTKDLEVMLFYVSPSVPPLFSEDTHDPFIRKQFSAWKTRKAKEGQQHLEATAKVLLEEGLKKEQIQSKYFQQSVGVARDIIREADSGNYDACVIGKKGMGWLGEMFLGSITNKLLEMAEGRPLWVVAGKGLDPRRVLLALDDSQQAGQLVQYAARMLRGVEGVEILLYHFCGPFCEITTEKELEEMKQIGEKQADRERRSMTQIFAETQKVFTALDFKKEAVESRFDADFSIGDKKISQRILAEAVKGQYGTVVLGRKGSNRAREFRLGSVTLRTLAKADQGTTWVV